MRIHPIQIATILLMIGVCSFSVSGKAILAEENNVRENESVVGSPVDTADDSPNKDDEKGKKQEEEVEEAEQSKDELPILPPIILLDFANDTEGNNVTSEEKSKRTVNSGLGYGLDKNSLHRSRKYNYYFPAGKSGTTVSIEESVSPFLPKTIIERVQPDDQRARFDTRQNSFATSFSEVNAQSRNQVDVRYLNVQQSAKSQSVYGLRTKPQKATAGSSLESYQNFLTTAKPSVNSFAIANSRYRNNDAPTSTQSPLAFDATETVRYVTPGTVNLLNSQSGSFNYATAAPSFSASGNAQTYATGQRQNIESAINSHGFVPVSQSVESSTAVGPLKYDPRFASSGLQFSNSPRYTLESGVRYENKIFWKYPDGRVSDVPPPTYVETYSQYPQSLAQQPAKSHSPHSIYESSSTENSILSQGPVQFPTVSEQTGQEPNPFVSGESLSSSLPQQQVYRLGYQNLVTQRQNVNLARQRKPSSNLPTSYPFSPSSAASSTRARTGSNASNDNHESRYQRPASRYMVNSPNPEYTSSYTTEPTVNSTTTLANFFASSTEHPPRSPSAYGPKVEHYLDAIPSEDNRSKKQSLNGNDLSHYSNLRYSDLLNYNPSISEYIRNPSSILNVRPTFVQAGNSLIPVIILRVDGASPIQTKATQNINLKALLQRYLIQYAKSIQELAQPSTYSLGADTISRGSTSGSNKSPVLDLIRLTQDDARETPNYDTNAYVGKSSYEASNLEEPKQFVDRRYTERSRGRQKVKSVQILEDPRYTSYKVHD